MSSSGRNKGLFFAFLLAGCSQTEPSDVFSHESVQAAAQRYYTHLVQGDAARFVEGMAETDRFPQDYSRQMHDVIAQASRGLAQKGGVVRVEALSDTLYKADSTAYVYLDLVFADSIHEQIGLPMIYRRGKWKMR
jgi:hypothetical protein